MDDVDWYLLGRDGRRYGPYDGSVVRQLHARGELREDTPVWHTGLARWQPARRLFRFDSAAEVPRPAPATTPPPPPAAGATATPASKVAQPPRGPRPAPSRARSQRVATPEQVAADQRTRDRLFASALDVLLVGAALGFARFFGAALSWNPLVEESRFTWLALWAAADAVLVCRLGTTPGRWLHGIRVQAADGGNLAPARAALRSALLLFTVVGAGNLVLAVVMMALAMGVIRARGRGWWDIAANSVVVHQDVPAWRRGLGTMLVVLLLMDILWMRQLVREFAGILI